MILLVAGCGHSVLDGQARSMRYDPDRAGGLAVDNGPSGRRPNSPPPFGTIQNTDNGAIDRLVLLAVNDIEAFWTDEYPRAFGGTFRPVSTLLSVDATDPSSPSVCGHTPDVIAFNALYCSQDDSINWDRSDQSGVLPVARKFFGDTSVPGILAHEYGHAIQRRANLPEFHISLVAEQQADCFAGVYLRWVAEGHSPRFTLGTGDGLNHMLAGLLALRDPLSTPDDPELVPNPHGTGLDRVSALQIGFEQGADACARIDSAEISSRRGDLPRDLFDPQSANSNEPITGDTLNALIAELNQIFQPNQPPTLTTGSASCDGRTMQYATYCPNSNTVAVDLTALQKIGTPADESQGVLLQGDNTAISLVTSRYVMATEQQRGLPLDTPQAAERTACLTGVAQRRMARGIDTPAGTAASLGAGDLDEAISGLLTNGVVASDIDGKTLPAGFTRISAFRSGLVSDTDDCYRRF